MGAAFSLLCSPPRCALTTLTHTPHHPHPSTARGINQLYIIGGDGTHRGADAVAGEALKRGIALAVAAVPKTIDNDVDIIDRSFGFDTAFAEAQHAIRSAKTEVAATHNGVGVVKLMGRYAGFIAAHATLASGVVDLCLVPELPIALGGPSCVLEYVQRVVSARGHAVVVVAEGAGEAEIAAESTGQGSRETDAGGNRKLLPVGPWFVGKVEAHFKAAGLPVAVKCACAGVGGVTQLRSLAPLSPPPHPLFPQTWTPAT